MTSFRRSTERLSKHELHAIYDQRYVDVYDRHAAQRMRRMLPYFELPADAVVADFACGNGVLCDVVGPRVRRYVGVDFSEAFIREAERRRIARDVHNAEFHCADIVAFCADHPDGFDAGFALDFSEHVYDDQFLRIFRAIHGALKPGAPLYLHTPNGEYFMERLRQIGVLPQIQGHVAVRGARGQEELLVRCGFRDIAVRYLPHYLRVASAFHFLSALPLAGRYFRARLLITCWK